MLTLGGIPASQSNCDCKKAHENQTTFISNENIQVTKKLIVKKLQGLVTDSTETPLSESLVEIFEKKGSRKRIKACWVDERGNFCVKNIPKGLYQLRISHEGFIAIYYEIEIDPVIKGKTLKKLKIKLNVAT
jgi:hypothetical protein